MAETNDWLSNDLLDAMSAQVEHERDSQFESTTSESARRLLETAVEASGGALGPKVEEMRAQADDALRSLRAGRVEEAEEYLRSFAASSVQRESR